MTKPHTATPLQNLTVAHPIKKLLALYGTRMFITVFTTALQWTLSWGRWPQRTPAVLCPSLTSPVLVKGPGDVWYRGHRWGYIVWVTAEWKEYTALVEWQWQGKTKVVGEKPTPETPQISHRLTWDRTRASAVRIRRLAALDVAQPQLQQPGLIQSALFGHNASCDCQQIPDWSISTQVYCP